MVRPATHHVDTGEVQLVCAEAGDPDQPTLVLLHGLAARWQVFGPVLPVLRERWHLLLPDLRGHGQSGRVAGRYAIPDFARDIAALCDLRAPDRVQLWGHSLGGWIGLYLAATRPDLVTALVVGDSAIYPEQVDPDAAISYLADLPVALRSISQSLRQLDPNVMEEFRGGRLVEGYHPATLLPSVACPTLLLQADPARDGLMTDEAARRAMDALTDGSHHRFEGIGHGLHVEDAAVVLESVIPFLDRHREVRGT